MEDVLAHYTRSEFLQAVENLIFYKLHCVGLYVKSYTVNTACLMLSKHFLMSIPKTERVRLFSDAQKIVVKLHKNEVTFADIKATYFKPTSDLATFARILHCGLAISTQAGHRKDIQTIRRNISAVQDAILFVKDAGIACKTDTCKEAQKRVDFHRHEKEISLRSTSAEIL